MSLGLATVDSLFHSRLVVVRLKDRDQMAVVRGLDAAPVRDTGGAETGYKAWWWNVTWRFDMLSLCQL